MIVVQVRPDLSFEIVDREKEMVRLGAGGLDGRALTPAAMAGGLEALSKFRRLADSHKVDEIIAAATSATREAENGGDFLAAVREQTGIDVRVISGAEEARLIHIAAAYGVDLGRRHGVVIDIGGGSVEITLGAAREPALAKSFKIGVIRLTERFVRADPLRASRRAPAGQAHRRGDRRARRPDRQPRLPARHRHVGHHPQPRRAWRWPPRRGHVVEDLHNRRVPAKALHKRPQGSWSHPTSGSAPADARPRSAPRRPRRRRRGAARHHPPPARRRRDHAVRPGAARRPDPRLRPAQPSGTSPPSSAIPTSAAAASRSSASAATTGRSTRARWRGSPPGCSTRRPTRHGLGAREREWLEFGALLHDVGVHISYRSHHKHSHYLIRHGDLRGFDPEEIEIIALVARYHRQATPKKSHEGYADLNGAGAAHRAPAVGVRPGRRGPRPQPRPGRRRPEGVGRRRRPRGAGRRRPATPSWNSGRRSATCRRSRPSSNAPSASTSRPRVGDAGFAKAPAAR